jgi:hypothetical protein
MSVPDDEQKQKPEPQTSGSPPAPPHGPIVTLTFSDSGEGSNHSGKKGIVRINLPPKPSEPRTVKGS